MRALIIILLLVSCARPCQDCTWDEAELHRTHATLNDQLTVIKRTGALVTDIYGNNETVTVETSHGASFIGMKFQYEISTVLEGRRAIVKLPWWLPLTENDAEEYVDRLTAPQ